LFDLVFLGLNALLDLFQGRQRMCLVLSEDGAMGTHESLIFDTDYFEGFLMNVAHAIDQGETFDFEVWTKGKSPLMLFDTTLSQTITIFLCKFRNQAKRISRGHLIYSAFLSVLKPILLVIQIH
jgi:hypothetical protein